MSSIPQEIRLCVFGGTNFDIVSIAEAQELMHAVRIKDAIIWCSYEKSICFLFAELANRHSLGLLQAHTTQGTVSIFTNCRRRETCTGRAHEAAVKEDPFD